MSLVFIYGTLQQEDVQISVLGQRLKTIPDRLDGYEKKENGVTINGNEYPIAVWSGQSSITGNTIEVTDEELQKLDEYETSAYDRIKVVLDSGRHAWLYCKPRSA